MRFLISSMLMVLLANAILAQSIEDLKRLSKDSLISLAVRKINNAVFKPDQFTNISVWTEAEELTVEFDHAIQFIPKRGQYYYSVSVELVKGSSSRRIMGDGEVDVVTYYNPDQFKKEVQFVLQSINKSDEVGKIPEGGLPYGTMTINEMGSYYDISVDSESTHSSYKIRKGSGKVYEASHKHYMRTENSNRVKLY